MIDLRKDNITREWVIIDTKKKKDFIAKGKKKRGTPPTYDENCPFCPGNEEMTLPETLAYRQKNSISNDKNWWLRVVPGKSGTLTPDGNFNRRTIGIYDKMSGIGMEEVIIESPLHNSTVATMPLRQVEEIIWAYRDRYQEIKKDSRFKYILVFKNHGMEDGSSTQHSCTQILVTPFIPQKIWATVKGIEQYREYRGKCVYCDMIEYEMVIGERLVEENSNFVACAPFASFSPYETWIIPKFHAHCFTEMGRHEMIDFARIIKRTLARIYSHLNDPPYTYSLITAPTDMERPGSYHWHLEIVPKLRIPEGFEVGTGIHVNPVSPEEAADSLRNAEIDTVDDIQGDMLVNCGEEYKTFSG